MASASPDGGNHAIHLFSHSSGPHRSMATVVHFMLGQVEFKIGERFHMGEGNKSATLDDSTAPCSCPPAPLRSVESKLLDIEARLQHVEKDLSVLLERIEPSDTSPNAGAPPSTDIWPTLLRIERTLQPIEQMTIRRTAKTATDTPLPDGCSTPVAVVSEIENQVTAPISEQGLSGLAPMETDTRGTVGHETETPTPDHTPGPHSPHSPAESECYDSDPSSSDGTVMTPSVTATVRSAAPWTGPDEAAEMNRDLMRGEINRALAVAMGNMARMLGGDGEV